MRTVTIVVLLALASGCSCSAEVRASALRLAEAARLNAQSLALVEEGVKRNKPEEREALLLLVARAAGNAAKSAEAAEKTAELAK